MSRLTWCKELCWQEKLDSSLDSSDRIVFSSQNHPSNRQAPVYDAYFAERRCIPASVSPHFSRYRPKSKIIRARKASLASLASSLPILRSYSRHAIMSFAQVAKRGAASGLRQQVVSRGECDIGP